MTVVLFALLGLGCAAALAASAWLNFRPPPVARRKPLATEWFDRTLKKKIVVHLKNDQSIEGVLMERTTDGVILRAAVLLGDAGKRTVMAGETFVPRENIAFSQLDE